MDIASLTRNDITAELIDSLLDQPEGPELEFKAEAGFNIPELCRYCCGFANSGGGLLVLGVSDKRPRQVVGTSALQNPAKAEEEIYAKVSPKPHVQVKEITYQEGHRVVAALIKRHPPGQPCAYKSDFWIRKGSQLVKMTSEDLRTIYKEVDPHWLEALVIKNASADEIIELLDIEQFYQLQKVKTRPAQAARIMNDLLEEGMIVKARSEDKYGLNRMGALLLAKSISACSKDLRNKRPRVIKYRGNAKNGVSLDRDWDKGYATSFDDLVDLVFSQMENREVFENGTIRREQAFVPQTALRELIANAIIHQDFENDRQLVVEIFDNRVVITNPGIPFLDEEDMILKHWARNMKVVDAMRLFGLCEKRSSGIDNAIIALEEEGHAPVEYRMDKNIGEMEAYLRGVKPYDDLGRELRELACRQHCAIRYVQDNYMTNESLRKRFGLDKDKTNEISKLIRKMVEEGHIKPFEGNGNSKKYASYVPARV